MSTPFMPLDILASASQMEDCVSPSQASFDEDDDYQDSDTHKSDEEDNPTSHSDDGKPFLCPVNSCGGRLSSKRSLVEHCREFHRGVKPHTCEFDGCHKVFLRPAHLVIHHRIHTGERPFECLFPGCGKRWNQKSALKQHMRSHTGEKPFRCFVATCQKTFSTSSSCKRHLQTHHRQQSHPQQQQQLNPQPNVMNAFVVTSTMTAPLSGAYPDSPVSSPCSPESFPSSPPSSAPSSPVSSPGSPLQLVSSPSIHHYSFIKSMDGTPIPSSSPSPFVPCPPMVAVAEPQTKMSLHFLIN